MTEASKPRKNTFLKRIFGISSKSSVRRDVSTTSVASQTTVSSTAIASKNQIDVKNISNNDGRRPIELIDKSDDKKMNGSVKNAEKFKKQDGKRERTDSQRHDKTKDHAKFDAVVENSTKEAQEFELIDIEEDTNGHLPVDGQSNSLSRIAQQQDAPQSSTTDTSTAHGVVLVEQDAKSETTLTRESDTSKSSGSSGNGHNLTSGNKRMHDDSNGITQDNLNGNGDNDENGPGIKTEDEDTLDEEPSRALQIYDGTANFIPQDEYASWLGSLANREILEEYMSLFNFTERNILSSLRLVCDKIYMRAESQQLHRIMEEFGKAWYNDNKSNGFGDPAAVYTIAYSILLLNTDLYAADHTTKKRINKSQFAHNTLQALFFQREMPKNQSKTSSNHKRLSMDGSKSLHLNDAIDLMIKDAKSLPFSKDWEKDIDTILRAFYISISQQPLKLSVIESDNSGSSTNHDESFSSISASRRPGSIVGGPSAIVDVNLNARPQTGSHSFSLLGKMSRLRKAHDHHESRIGTSTLDEFADGSLKGTISSNFSMNTGLSLFGINRQAVGFAGLLWNSMKEQDEVFEDEEDQPFDNFAQIKQEITKEEERELRGAPWVKEGISLYRPYTDPNTGKKNRKKTWKQMFTVVQRGQLRMFSFDTQSRRQGGQVGDGNWTDHAEFVDGFHLCHTMAQEAPSSTNISQFNAVWSLTLPQRGLLVFRTGTPEIAREFVYTCNYWAARLSKEPFEESISSMEYGWSIQPEEMKPGLDSKKPGDKMTICDWQPAGQSLLPSDLTEETQLKNLREYVAKTEKQLAQHNALRSRIMESFSPNSQNMARAQANWEKKSQYLLQQVIRFQVYADTLQQAINDGKVKSLGSEN